MKSSTAGAWMIIGGMLAATGAFGDVMHNRISGALLVVGILIFVWALFTPGN